MDLLPDDLLYSIIGLFGRPATYLRNDHLPELLAISLTSRRLSTIARKFLWRDVDIEIATEEQPDERMAQLFNRSCVERPACVNHVRSAHISCSNVRDPDQDSKIPQAALVKIYGQLLLHLSRSTRLECLNFNVGRHIRTCDLPAVFKPDADSFVNLSQVCIQATRSRRVASIHPDELLAFLRLPRLEDLRVSVNLGQIDKGTSIDQLSKLTFASATLRDIVLSSITHLDVLRLILPRSPKLTELEVIVSDDMPFTEKKDPLVLMSLLKPVRQKLEALTVLSWGYDTSRTSSFVCDFSVFPQLQHLAIDAYLIFGQVSTPRHCSWISDLRTLMLPRLEELLVLFDQGDIGIVYPLSAASPTFQEIREDLGLGHEDEDEFVFPAGDSPGIISELAWLDDFIERNHPALPHLRIVELMETDAKHNGVVYETVLWPEGNETAVHEKFNEQGIQLNISLRVPQLEDTDLLIGSDSDNWSTEESDN